MAALRLRGSVRTALLVAAVLTVFALVLAVLTVRVRGHIRAQLLSEQATLLYAGARFQASRPGLDPLDLVLDMIALEGVLGVRMYDTAGRVVAVLPDHLVSGRLPEDVHASLAADTPAARFESSARLFTEFADPLGILSEKPVPLLQVYVPVAAGPGPDQAAYAQFLMDGRTMADALRALDRQLTAQWTVAFTVGGGLILLILAGSLRRLDRKNRELLEANRELAMHAKTSAVGAISAHLLHGLRNFVSGMQLENGAAGPAARRVQAMIQEIVEVIQEETRPLNYALTSGEIMALLHERVYRDAEQAGVQFSFEGDRQVTFTNRQGNLILLILENLVRNALDAVPSGKAVVCRFSRNAAFAAFAICDQGTGVPSRIRERLFQPGPSDKPGGSGIGLSLSRHLARHIEAELALAHTGPEGSEFVLRVPLPDGGTSVGTGPKEELNSDRHAG